MTTLRIWKRNASWNMNSALINPLVVFCVSIGIIYVSIREKGFLYVLPLAVLAANSVLSFAFWSLRLAPAYGSRRPPVVLTVGYGSYVIGCTGLLALVVLSLVTLSNAIGAGWKLGFSPDLKFWIFWSWAMIEGIHHYIYKLKLGRCDTLQCVVESGDWSRSGRPVGGAIGIQLRKLRRVNRHVPVDRK